MAANDFQRICLPPLSSSPEPGLNHNPGQSALPHQGSHAYRRIRPEPNARPHDTGLSKDELDMAERLVKRTAITERERKSYGSNERAARRLTKAWTMKNRDCRRRYCPEFDLKSPVYCPVVSLDKALKQFDRVKATGHIQFFDKKNRKFAYLFRYDQANYESLLESDQLFSAAQARSHKRGVYDNRHWGVWAEYGNGEKLQPGWKPPHNTAEYQKDIDAGLVEPWMKLNRKLLHELDNALRFEFLDQYISGRNHTFHQKTDPLPCAWHGMAINRGMQGDASLAHYDYKDNPNFPNAIVPYGEWTGGDLILWEARLVIEVPPGWSLLFLGKLIRHQVCPIVTGTRNVLDFFAHKSDWDARKRLHELRGKEDRRPGTLRKQRQAAKRVAAASAVQPNKQNASIRKESQVATPGDASNATGAADDAQKGKRKNETGKGNGAGSARPPKRARRLSRGQAAKHTSSMAQAPIEISSEGGEGS